MKSASLLLALAATFLLPFSLSAAEDDEKHPIDKEYEACVDKNGSTAGMVECTDKAYKKWDAELNRVYSALLKKLPAKKAAELKQSQRDWLVYRDSTFKVIDSLYADMQGTMYIPMHVYARLRVVRERALLLGGYLELRNESGQ